MRSGYFALKKSLWQKTKSAFRECGGNYWLKSGEKDAIIAIPFVLAVNVASTDHIDTDFKS